MKLMMKEYKMETGAYEAPRVEVIEVQVEKGFAGSLGTIGAGNWENGGGGDLSTGY